MDDKENILNEIFRLIHEEQMEEQTESQQSIEVAMRCQERSDRILKLLGQIRQHPVS